VLLFVDMESSTVIAERLGEAGFLDFLNRFVAANREKYREFHEI
jgi:hypothetical protein